VCCCGVKALRMWQGDKFLFHQRQPVAEPTGAGGKGALRKGETGAI
jgi:hypothetical protein